MDKRADQKVAVHEMQARENWRRSRGTKESRGDQMGIREKMSHPRILQEKAFPSYARHGAWKTTSGHGQEVVVAA